MRHKLYKDLASVFTNAGFHVSVCTSSYTSGKIAMSLPDSPFEEMCVYFAYSDNNCLSSNDSLSYDRIQVRGKELNEKFYIKYNMERDKYRNCIARLNELAAEAFAEAQADAVSA